MKSPEATAKLRLQSHRLRSHWGHNFMVMEFTGTNVPMARQITVDRLDIQVHPGHPLSEWLKTEEAKRFKVTLTLEPIDGESE